MKQLVIRLLWPQDNPAAMGSWLCEYAASGFAANEGPLADWVTESGVLADILPRVAALQAPDVQLTILWPAELTLFDCVSLPARQQRQALQALPFVVEEWLADDIEDVHLAIGARLPGGEWPVMVIASTWMDAFRELMAQHGVRPHHLLADAQCFGLPGQQGLSIMMAGERALVQTDRVASAVDLDSLVSLVHLLTRDKAPAAVQIQTDDASERHGMLAQQLATEMAALDAVETRIEQRATPLVVRLAEAARTAAPAPINLLQGDYLVHQPRQGMAWTHLAAAIAGLALVGQLSLQLLSGWYFGHQAGVIEKQMEAQYRELYPDARQASNPRKRLAGKLGEAGMAGNDGSFAYVFGTSIKAMQSLQEPGGLVIQQLRYEAKRGELELEVTAKSIEQLDQYKQTLVKQGLQAEIASANEGEGGIMGRIQIKAGA